FLLIGMITAVWRASGTIPFIVYHCARFFAPRTTLLFTFLLCCGVSSLTGTAFGTAATVGVICGAVATSMGISPVLWGGAVLAGSYFGDRCSPMSTSALLVCALTKTDIYRNIRAMVKTAAVPFVLSCLVYLLLGGGASAGEGGGAVCEIFASRFVFSPWLILPAAVIVVFSLLKVPVKITMLVSILVAAALALSVQSVPFAALCRMLLSGFAAEDAALAALLNGGGILSMKNGFFIVCLSSTYAGIFQGTGFLKGIQSHIRALSQKLTPYGSVLFTAIVTSLISYNQTLATMLTHQLCQSEVEEEERMAIFLENTVVVIAPLVPWSVAGAVPLASVGAPTAAIFAACYLYLLPLWTYAVQLRPKCK
ncbi:MAG: sodium:proton antiporter, partial [Oscillospiraceae bacterium]|nr:sodium:proton antiporter [Oscillospiraceae bacterium]